MQGEQFPANAYEPQWGRLSSSRITGHSPARWSQQPAAAMGPALIEPDHPALRGRGVERDAAAMGPALIEPDHQDDA